MNSFRTPEISPSFKRPPVIETLLSVQFNPFPDFTNGHLGAFWKSLGEREWPRAQDAPLVEEQNERFGEEEAWARMGMQLRISQVPNARLQILNEGGNRMIQIQTGRFIYNWIRKNDDYPRHKAMKKEFDGLWKQFEEFCSGYKWKVVPNQWEVTYVNRLERGAVWSTSSDLANVISLLGKGLPTESGLVFEGMGGEWHFEIAPRRGRLHVQLQSARENMEAVMLLKLTARGPISESEGSDLNAGIQLGHDAIVSAFSLMTSSEAQKLWEREQ